ncbi:hypothetical protein MXB_4844 [Myxobolus squamalis]|nr:hypothetical protein MXB_4844 [Myxobolus squamalis]
MATLSFKEIIDQKGVNKISLENNLAKISNFKIFLSLTTGITAGIIGIVSWKGFLLYFIAYLAGSIMLIPKFGTDGKFVTSILNQLVIADLLPRLVPFMFTWTLVYSLLHVY